MTFVSPPRSVAANVGALAPQILQNKKQRHTGALSPATLKMRCLGAVARLLTTLHDSADAILVLGFATSVALNAVLLLQVRAYAAGTADALAKKKKRA